MTREEIAKWLENLKGDIGKSENQPLWHYAEALGMVIETLKREPCEDLISRAEAIEAIELVDWYHQNKNKDMVHGANDDEHQAWYKADDVYKALEAVPSADRPRGYWKHNTTYRSLVFCSECDMPYEAGMTPRNFCPNCGADMKGETDEL